MKLYYSAGSCSTCCHILLEESGLKYEAIEVDWDKPSDPNVALVAKLNPLETLPILITDDGRQLDQNLSILTYVADQVPEKNLLPAHGTYERAAALNWLSFVAADLHKSIGSLFGVQGFSNDKSIQDLYRKFWTDKSVQKLNYMEDKLNGKDYLMGQQFTPADAYAYIVTGWTKWVEIPLTPYKNIQAFMARMEKRPAVARVLKAEGLT